MKNIAYAIAKTLLNGFERHIFLFTEITRSAQQRFEQCQWREIQKAARERTDFYELRVKETLTTLKHDFAIQTLDQALWQSVKQVYFLHIHNLS